MPNRRDDNIEDVPERVDLTRVYLEVRHVRNRVDRLDRHVVAESEPERGVLYRLSKAEADIEANSKSIETIREIPARIAWIAVAAIVTLTVTGVATLVWHAARQQNQPTAQQQQQQGKTP